MKVTIYDSACEPAHVESDCKIGVTHVIYKHPLGKPQVEVLFFTQDTEPESPDGGSMTLAFASMSPDEAEALAHRLIVQAAKARGNI